MIHIQKNHQIEQKDLRYRNVLDKFIISKPKKIKEKEEEKVKEIEREPEKEENPNNNNDNNKTILSETSESNQISDFSLHFLKPNDKIMKLPKNENTNEKNESNDESNLELPNDLNINDGKDLKQYKNLVNNNEQKSKVHLSVLYYKKLNKSFNQVYSKDLDNKNNNNNKHNNSAFKGFQEKKTIEYLREL